MQSKIDNHPCATGASLRHVPTTMKSRFETRSAIRKYGPGTKRSTLIKEIQSTISQLVVRHQAGFKIPANFIQDKVN